MAVLEQAVQTQAEPLANLATLPPLQPNHPRKGPIVGYDRRGHPILRFGWKTIEQISAEMRVKYPEPIQGAPLAVDIIREERDAR